MLPLLLPELGDTVSQLADSLTVQLLQLPDTLMVLVPPAAFAVSIVGLTLSVLAQLAVS